MELKTANDIIVGRISEDSFEETKVRIKGGNIYIDVDALR